MHTFFAQNGFVVVAEHSLPLIIGAGITLFMLLANSISLRLSLR
jgi:hypothetical protein